MPGATTYLLTDGERLQLGRYNSASPDSESASFYMDLSDTALHIAVPSGYNFSFDVDTTAEWTFDATGFVFNDGSNDRDFRVESCGETNMLFVDGGNNQVGVGGAVGPNTTSRMYIEDDATGASASPLNFLHRSSSPADDDEQIIGWFAMDDTCPAVATELARLTVIQRDFTNCTDDAQISFDVMVGGTLLNDVFSIGGDASCVAAVRINVDTDDVDFIVAGANTANAILLCAANDALSFGGANVDGSAFILNNTQVRTGVVSVGLQLHMPAQTTLVDNAGCTTLGQGAAVWLELQTWNNTAGTETTYTDAATLWLAGTPIGVACNVVLTRATTLMIESGSLTYGVVGGAGATTVYNGSSCGTVTFQVAAGAGTYTITWPTTDGNACQRLITNGSGVLSWANASYRECKNISGLTCPDVAYNNIVNAQVYDFTYKPEWSDDINTRDTGPMTGIVAEEAPWAMQGKDHGAFSDINAFGQLTVAFQVLAGKVAALEVAGGRRKTKEG